MSEREGTEIREELVIGDQQGEAVSWSESVDRFQAWYDDQRGTEVVVCNEVGEMESFTTPNRFSPEYRERQYAKAQALERGLRKKWGSMLTTTMLTLTASSTTDSGAPRCPVDHHRDVLSSWSAVRRALSRVLEGREWEYLAILEPHESGYTHVHIGVFVRGPVVAEQFQPVLDAHLRNCPTAGRDAHRIHPEDGDGAVEVHETAGGGPDDGIENLGAYLASYLAGEYGAEPAEMPAHVRRWYAVMWATGDQWFRASNGAQEHMRAPDGESSDLEWEMVGVAPDGDLDELVEVDPAATRHPYASVVPPPGRD